MNSPVSNSVINTTWKRVKGEYIAAALGLTLAVSAAVAISGDLKSPSMHQVSSSSTRLATSTSAAIEISTRPEVVFYLVATDEQADEVQEHEELARWVRFDAGAPEPSTADVVRVLVVAGDSDYVKAMDIIDRATEDWAATGGGDVKVLDLRQR